MWASSARPPRSYRPRSKISPPNPPWGPVEATIGGDLKEQSIVLHPRPPPQVHHSRSRTRTGLPGNLSIILAPPSLVGTLPRRKSGIEWGVGGIAPPRPCGATPFSQPCILYIASSIGKPATCPWVGRTRSTGSTRREPSPAMPTPEHVAQPLMHLIRVSRMGRRG